MVSYTSTLQNIFFVYIVLHQKHEGLNMATGPKNAKSQSVTARIAHEIIEGMENVKEEGESTGQFINAAMRGEIKRRQRRKAKEPE